MRVQTLLILGVSLFSTPLVAQEWSAEQREVLQFVDGCWEAWARSVEAHDDSIWRSACRPAENLKWWWMPDPVPETFDTLERQFAWQVENIERVVWWDVRPIAVQLAGDVAIVMLYSEGSWVGTDGEPFNFGSKRLEVFERDGSNWSFLASMVHPTGEISR